MTSERGPRAPLRHVWTLVGTAAALALVVALVMLSTGAASAARSALFPAPKPTATTPAWLEAPSSAPTLAGATPLSATAPVPAAAALAQELGARLTPGSGSVSASVLDGLTGQTLFGQADGEARVPASNLKLLTAAAALTTLGPDATITTQAVRGADPGTVVLVGGGDVMLGAGASQPGAILGRAGLATLAAETAKALTGASGAHDGDSSPRGGASPPSTVTVRLDDTLFTGPALNPAWAQEDVDAGEMAPLYALALNSGRSAPGATGPRPKDSALDAASAFRGELAKALEGSGVSVADGVERASAPAGAARLASVESATIAEQAGYALRESDNYAAEALARLASRAAGGPASNDGAVAALKAAATRILPRADGVQLADQFQLSDASGLALADRASPRALAGIVRAMTSGPDPRLRAALDGLPVAGLDGTLSSRFGGTTAAGAGVVRAKTGTLNTVTALSGYLVDADGRLLVFSFVANDLDPGARARAVEAIDAGVAALAGCGCQG